MLIGILLLSFKNEWDYFSKNNSFDVWKIIIIIIIFLYFKPVNYHPAFLFLLKKAFREW